jgi:sigma-E factor negative regulatory protein RseA
MNPSSDPSYLAPVDADARQWLSAAADGEGPAVDKASQLWRVSEDARSTWHRYHLIGDVMRSAELARPAAHDAAFLTALRSRMAAEPVLLAPATKPSVAAPARRWLAPAAVAAGLMAVAGVLVVSRLSGPVEASGAVTAAVELPAGVRQVSHGALALGAQPAVGTLIRDPRLDEFLRAHQSARGGLAAALPGNTLRRVEANGPEGSAK